jgi:uncharacterized membrane protein YeaQ/YmgE (transglycosylase-associated protein family)
MPPAPPTGGQFDYGSMGSSYGSSGPAPAGTKLITKLWYFIGMGVMTLIIPLGMYKIGTPAPCEGDRLKNKECVVVAEPADCTPSRFNMESAFLTCKMVGAFASPDFKEIDKKFAEDNPDKAAACSKLNDEVVKSNGFKCYATSAMFVGKIGKDGKGPDVMGMPPLDVQKMSVLASMPSSVLSGDMLFTIIIFITIMLLMGAAGYMAHKKHRDGFLHVCGVFMIGMLAAYIYRYFLAGFYQGNVMVLIFSLLGAVPLVVIAMSAAGRIGRMKEENIIVGAGDYKMGAPVPEKPVITEALPVREATRFERMAMEHTPIMRSVFTIGFIALVLSLMPIGLLAMGQSSNANAKMQQEAKVSTMMRKNAEEATSSDSTAETEEGGEIAAPEDGEAAGGGGEAAPE